MYPKQKIVVIILNYSTIKPTGKTNLRMPSRRVGKYQNNQIKNRNNVLNLMELAQDIVMLTLINSVMNNQATETTELFNIPLLVSYAVLL